MTQYANVEGFVYRPWDIDFCKKTFAFGKEGKDKGIFEVFWLHVSGAAFFSLIVLLIVALAYLIGLVGLIIGIGIIPLVFTVTFALTWIPPFKYWYNMMIQQFEASLHKNHRCEIYQINDTIVRIKHKNVKFHYHMFGDFKTQCLKMRTRKVELRYKKKGRKSKEYWCTEILFKKIPKDGKLVISYV